MENKTNRMGEETMECKCNLCSKEMHIKEALYCTRCGTQLDLSKSVKKMGHHFH